jgi:hypothetical protein
VVSISTALPSGGRVCTAPRLRQSLAALVSGYGLNEKPGYGLNEKLKARRRLILLPCSLASIRPSKFAQPANFLKSDPADVR